MAAIYHRPAMARRRRTQREPKDPVRLEVFHHLFAAAAEEMGAALQRSAFSPNVKERRDFSCALFDRAGRMVSQAAHIPVHLGSIPLCVEACREELELGPGDTAILNDPFRGGTHLPDVTLVTPVFLSRRAEERREPDFYCANRAHHADVGGAYPGSMAPAADLHGEGLCIPPTRLVRAGEVDRGVLALLLANMRVPAEREGDLMAQWSANRLGARRLAAMAAEYGLEELERRAGELMDWTEALAVELVRSLPRREVRFEQALEVAGSGAGSRPGAGTGQAAGEARVCVRL
jgi:N-methylhydantoinase B